MNNEGKTGCQKQTPCKTCPFRSDVEFVLSAGKVTSIVGALLEDGDFACHNTTVATGGRLGNEKVCIGAAIFLEKVRKGGLRANLSFRLREHYKGDFVREQLDMDAPVFECEADFIRARA